jgi:shikimate kinase
VNIFLIGPMGAGKSTIGKLLAKSFGRDFLDSDKEIERRTGVSIPMIFEYEGEAGFRRRESEMIAQLSARDEIVLATGGGAVILSENRDILRRRGFVAYLTCSIDRQLERTQRDSHRPLLNIANPRERLEELFLEREPLYAEIADVTIDTGSVSGQAAVRQITRAYQDARRGRPAP